MPLLEYYAGLRKSLAQLSKLASSLCSSTSFLTDLHPICRCPHQFVHQIRHESAFLLFSCFLLGFAPFDPNGGRHAKLIRLLTAVAGSAEM